MRVIRVQVYYLHVYSHLLRLSNEGRLRNLYSLLDAYGATFSTLCISRQDRFAAYLLLVSGHLARLLFTFLSYLCGYLLDVVIRRLFLPSYFEGLEVSNVGRVGRLYLGSWGVLSFSVSGVLLYHDMCCSGLLLCERQLMLQLLWGLLSSYSLYRLLYYAYVGL